MEILIRSRTCRITFDKTDALYAGKTLVLEGEGVDESTFCVHKHLNIFWSISSTDNLHQSAGVLVEGTDRESILSYVMMRTEEAGYKLTLW